MKTFARRKGTFFFKVFSALQAHSKKLQRECISYFKFIMREWKASGKQNCKFVVSLDIIFDIEPIFDLSGMLERRRNVARLQDVLARGKGMLGYPIVQGAQLDAQILLCHVLEIERAMLYAYPEREITSQQEEQYFALIARRMQHEPVAYLTEHKEFYGLDFFVDKRVLIPRPETELLVERSLEIIKRSIAGGHVPVVADVGTGSGAIPISIAVEEPRLPYLYATDISPDALEVARLNCQRHHVAERVRLLQGNLISPLPEPVDVLLANLPYIGTDEIDDIPPDVRFYEPYQALFSGPDGLDLLRRLAEEVRRCHILKPAGVLLLEIGYQQCMQLTDLMHDLWDNASIVCIKDDAGFDRILQITTF
jgi:release factor glutamine methyltransferase